MLEVSGLTVRYGQHRALEEAAIRVERGEIVVILGANGAGKSTLLKAISGICEGRVSGSVQVDGTELLGLPASRIVEEGIALVPEGRGVFGDLSVRENLVLGAYSDRARAEEAANLDRVLALFPKLAERAGQVVRTMSGGEQQMVAIGRAMMSNPAFLTLDEPSLGLSPLLCRELFQNLARVRELGLGILLVEQNAKQSLAIADRGYLLENAHIVHEGAAAELRRDPAVQAAYLGAGGAAAPQTHDPAPGAPDGPATGPATGVNTGPDTGPGTGPGTTTAAPGFTPRPASRQTVSADTLLGRPVADLVAEATRPRRPEAAAAPQPAPEAAQDRLRATLAEIERAARAARRPRPGSSPGTGPGKGPEKTAERPPDRSPARSPDRSPDRSTDTTPDAAPARVEIYRAPRVEIYRRRPGGQDFERS